MKKELLQISPNEMISSDHFESLKQRLESLGFVAGAEIEIIRKISFDQVIVVRLFQTVVALNKLEFSCLKF